MGDMANFSFLFVCMCQPLFVGYIYIAKKLYEKLKVVIFFEINIVIRIQPNFKKIHQNYPHG
jgi:hypothetical protein